MEPDLYLCAHAINAISLEAAQVEFEIASPSADGNWYTNDGRRLWPFWTTPIREPLPPIPEGWIEYLHREAAKAAAGRSASVNILALLPKPAPGPTIRRRL